MTRRRPPQWQPYTALEIVRRSQLSIARVQRERSQLLNDEMVGAAWAEVERLLVLLLDRAAA